MGSNWGGPLGARLARLLEFIGLGHCLRVDGDYEMLVLRYGPWQK
jgi:hypothetical protein